MSDDLAVFRELMRLRGFSLMTNLMNDYKEDDEVLLLVRVSSRDASTSGRI